MIKANANKIAEQENALRELLQKVHWMYNEQMKDKEKIRSLESEARPGYKKGMVDLRNMNPDKYTGPRGATSFRQWGQDLKDLADR